MTASPVTLRVLIVDDEEMARARLRRLLAECGEVDVVGEAPDGPGAVEAIGALRPDLVFLDVSMPGFDGFQVVQSIPEGALPLIVFVTAFDEHALRAFDVHALDYLLKPFDAERLQRTLRRARARTEPPASRGEVLRVLEQIAGGPQGREGSVPRPTPAAAPFADRLLVRANGRMRFVPVADIEYIESASNYVRLHTAAGAQLMREPLGVLAGRLDPATFVRVHRCTIVNVSRIAEIEPWFSGDALLVLRSGAKVRMSRSFRDGLQGVLTNRQ